MSTPSSLVMQPNPYPESAPMITHCGILANANALTAISSRRKSSREDGAPFFQC